MGLGKQFVSAAIVGCAVGAFGCGPGGMPPSLSHPLAGGQAPSFREITKPDRDVGLPGATDAKVTVVEFWASWCQGCEEAMPLLDELYRDKRGAGLAVVGVNVDDRGGDAYAAAQRFHASFPIVVDPDMRIASSFNVSQVPLTFVLDRNNSVRWVGRDPGAMRRAVEVVLAE